MPRRDDLQTILILGAGPIVIGQGCEFDYSGAQACKALREEGYRVVLVNSNPATIMTDPEFSDRTYIEPVTPEAVEKVIAREAELGHPIDALLPTLGGQTALNCACAMFDDGTLARHNVEMIGATREVIYRAEDRQLFKQVMEGIGLKCADSGIAHTMDEARAVLERTGLPAIIRPAFTLGGAGGGVAYNLEEFEDIARRGLDASMTTQVVIDRSLLGWKEYEMEVMRDRDDNAVIVCAIENFDAMGVHTGDSITVAPAQTLTDKEYQRMRDASLAILRAVGVETGGSNCQFAINPADGEMVVIEMNPRVSRSSALASKATGFPIAKIAAKLAVGYRLWELPNDVTGQTIACFEPAIDYVVTKIPRWTFEKFPEADETLTTQMKSVGEGMSIGRTFKESLQKGVRSMEVQRAGFGLDGADAWLKHRRSPDDPDTPWPVDEEKLRRKLRVPSQGRLYYLRYALKAGWSVAQVYEATGIDPWFLDQLEQLVRFEDTLVAAGELEKLDSETMFEAKRLGYSDAQLAELYLGASEAGDVLQVRAAREALGVKPSYKLVDTCAAEFEAATPYYYSTYEAGTRVAGGESLSADELDVSDNPKIVILGGGPNRIGQGIEFDYCCVQAAFAADELGFESVMINSNPETVSTDYDTSDVLFFEPLTLEDVLNAVERLNGRPFSDPDGLVKGVIVQYGGQTPLNLAEGLQTAGVPILGTAVDAIAEAEDRERFAGLCRRLDVRQPANGIALSVDEAVAIAQRIGYPVLVRPSFVLGGRAMETVFDDEQLRRYMAKAIGASDLRGKPILIDQFLAEAIECDVDLVADYGIPGGNQARVAAVMEHIEEAGIHSGDSACTIPPYSLPAEAVELIRAQTRKLAEALGVCGLMNAQWAVRRTADGGFELFIIEVNPRASRTVPFVGKATGVPWARIAARCMMGQSLKDQNVQEVTPAHTSVKEAVFPFSKFPGVDVILGPEMRSTGEAMGADPSEGVAFAKSQMSAGASLPSGGAVFVSLREADKAAALEPVRGLVELGFTLVATRGTRRYLAEHGIEAEPVLKISEGRPNAIDLMKNGQLDLIFNTPTRKGAGTDEGKLRATAVRQGLTMITTATAMHAAVRAMQAMREGAWSVRALQDYFPHLARPAFERETVQA
ncbi:MAG: carbamoyl-phosphate synthase large subunit [Planctomycetota bacterium]